MDDNSNKNIIFIFAGVFLFLLLCCCCTTIIVFAFSRTSTRNLIRNTPEPTLYNNGDLPLISPSQQPIRNESEIKSFTATIMTTFKEKGSKEVYDKYSDPNFKKSINYNLYSSFLDPYQKYDSYTVNSISRFFDDDFDEYLVRGTLRKDNKTYYFSLNIFQNNNEYKAGDFTISSYKF